MRYTILYRYLILLILIMAANVAEAQIIKTKSDLDKKSLKTYNKAIAEGRKKKYDKSLSLFNKVLEKHPEFIDAQLRKGGMLHNMKAYEQSAVAFEKAIAMAPDYDPQMYYSLAIVRRDLKDFDAAAEYFQSYIERSTDDKRKARAADLRDRCAFAHEAMSNPVPFDPQVVEGGVRSPYSEYAPVVTMEGDRLIFTRRVAHQEDFYVGEIKDGQVTRVVPVDGLNTPQNEGLHTISADGKTMIFTACDRRATGIGSCDLYYAHLDADYWSIPSNMGKVVNSISWDSQPSLSADGNRLFFSSGRQDGYGGNDIWMTTRTDTSGWARPVLLPETINTSGNEESPFIHPDGKTLYFRSNKRIGMGGYDIFYSRFVDSLDTWTLAQNIGYPINTEGDEGALSVSLDGKTAYFASDMLYLDDRANANLDIFSFELYPEARPLLTTFIRATIVDGDTGEPLAARYEIKVLSDDSEAVSGVADKDGSFISSLLTNESYGLFVTMQGYLHHSEYLDLTGVRDAVDPYRIHVELSKLKPENNAEHTVPEPVVLNNIFFAFGKAELVSTSDYELDVLASMLQDDLSINVEIRGHTDDVGSEMDNQLLSEQRAKAVAEALVERGIEPGRVTYVGYGETLPVADNATEEGRRKNRRTEFILK